MEQESDSRLVLASTSVYRRGLLERLRLPFRTARPDTDETPLPGEAGEATAALWITAREALESATAIDSEPPRLLIQSWRRTLERNLRLRWERRDTTEVRTRRPFSEETPSNLERVGYIQMRRDGLVYYGPGADLLLSERFLKSHCFRRQEGTGAATGLVGLFFEPLPAQRLPDVTGVLTGSVPAMQPAHEWAQINVTTSCVNGGGGAQPPINVWIDPAGTVKDTLGNPLVGAKVVLYKLNTDTNVFEVVPNGSGIMADKNRKNPDATGLYADFSWAVLPGRYKVRASYPGCHAVGKPTQPYVDSAAYDIPPPALGIKLVLQCAAPGGGTTPGVTVKLTDNGDQRWQRYCKNVVVTNTNNFPVDWKVKFDLPYPGYIDPVPSGHWNFNYTAAGKTITAWGVDWNKTLAPKATSHSIGFCAFKN